MSPQQFVDYLNHKEMPQLGYELVDGYWCWPIYDHGKPDLAAPTPGYPNGKNRDFDGKDWIGAQRKRLGVDEYAPELYPADHE